MCMKSVVIMNMKDGDVVWRFSFNSELQSIVFTHDEDGTITMCLGQVDKPDIAHVYNITDYDVVVGIRSISHYLIEKCAQSYDSLYEFDLDAINAIQTVLGIDEAETPDDVANAVATMYGIQIF